jgi:hypothetical protein
VEQPDPVLLPPSALRTDGGTQQRVTVPPDAVDDYADHLDDLPPVLAYWDGTHYWLADGFIRLLAHLKAKREVIRVIVREGTQDDAILHSCGVNDAHGTRRTPADKRNAVRTLLMRSDWRSRGDNWAAKICRVSNHLVARVRGELFPAQVGNVQPAAPPERRQGADGKSYPASHAAPAPRPLPKGESAPRDGVGIEIPPERRRVFAACDLMDEVAGLLELTQAKLRDLLAHPGAADFQAGNPLWKAVEAAEASLDRDRPHCCACVCREAGKCPRCGGRGWLTRRRFAALPSPEQRKLLAIAEAQSEDDA